MRDPKMLLKLLRLLLQGDPPASPIQKIVLIGDAAPPRVTQSGLFVPKGPDPEKLELTVARLAKLVGEGNVGVAELLDTYRSENFRMSKFASVTEPAKCRRKVSVASPGGENPPQVSGGTAVGFRMIRPVVPVNVELREARPARVFFRGSKGEVTSASGPWRGSGDWWQEDAWDHDEWDLAIDFGASGSQRREQRERHNEPLPVRGVYRVYYDAQRRNWFVRGFYD
jgi:protein ImuB